MKVYDFVRRLPAEAAYRLKRPRIEWLPGNYPAQGFHLDDLIFSDTSGYLRQGGIDLTTHEKPEIAHLSSLDHFQYAMIRGRIFVTPDPRYRKYHRYHSGVIYVPFGCERGCELLSLCLALQARCEVPCRVELIYQPANAPGMCVHKDSFPNH